MTKDTILVAAEALFMKTGIQATSLADIALQAGISKGTLFYHFKSKDHLIMEIAFSHIKKVSDEVLTHIQGLQVNGPTANTAKHQPKEQNGQMEIKKLKLLLEEFLEAILASTLRNKLHLYLIEDCISRNPALRKTLKSKYEEWLAILETALRQFIGDRASQYAPIILAITDGLIIQATLDIKLPPIRKLLDTMFPD